MIRVKLKLARIVKPFTNRRFAVERLGEQEVRDMFRIELHNRFQGLDMDCDEDKAWENIKETYQKTSEKVLGYRKKMAKPWLSRESWKKVKERKNVKRKMLGTRSKRIRNKLQIEYKRKDAEVKRSVRKDKRAFVDSKGHEAEDAASRGELGTVHRITKELCGRNRNQSMPVRDTDGFLVTNEGDQTKRWAEHFKTVLNRALPDNPVDVNEP